VHTGRDPHDHHISRPAAVARCRDAADVISCVRFGREHGAEIAVRGGGHSAAGLRMADGALAPIRGGADPAARVSP
jgi:FAD/FMN-containing dehydrogenase